MNIALVHGYIKGKDIDIYMSEPLGLICLATYLDQQLGEKVDTTIIDLYAAGAMEPTADGDIICHGKSDPEYIRQQIESVQPDMIGIHCNFTAYADDSYELAETIKNLFPNIPIVIGGAHPTIEGAEIMRNHPYIDIVAKGEGEQIIEALARHYMGEIPIEEVPGILHRVDGKVVANKPVELMKDLDVLPIPKRDYVDMEKYTYFNKETIWYVKNNPIATIMTSRGCPYNCVFCSTKVVWTRKWRFRSLEKVFEEIHDLVENHGVREIVINDDQFMTRRKRIHAFCDHFIEAKLPVTFAVDSGISIWLIDEELLKKMKKAGFYSLRFPIETGCKETLKYVKKPVNLDKAKDMIRIATRMGFWTSSNIIVGFPNETREQVMESIRYVYESTLDFTSFIIAKPHAGSEMYEDFKSEGLLEKNVVRGSGFYSSDYDTNFLTAQELQDIVNKASSDWFMHKALFYLNPINFYLYFIPKVKTIPDFLYFCKVAGVIFNRKILPILKSKLKSRPWVSDSLPANRKV
ncbi:MAG: hypothetical protein CL677_10385 [Bdellovibrionaceae bacterium]|nr:hypothetical protein [Pseudobdellovibrionaceae bacterium]